MTDTITPPDISAAASEPTPAKVEILERVNLTSKYTEMWFMGRNGPVDRVWDEYTKMWKLDALLDRVQGIDIPNKGWHGVVIQFEQRAGSWEPAAILGRLSPALPAHESDDDD